MCKTGIKLEMKMALDQPASPPHSGAEAGAQHTALSCRQEEQGWTRGCWPITFLTLLSRWQSVKTTCEHPCCFRRCRTV